MRDQMRVGDLAFFYHSSCKVWVDTVCILYRRQAGPGSRDAHNQIMRPSRTHQVPGIVGLLEVVKGAYPDHFQFVRRLGVVYGRTVPQATTAGAT